MTKAEIIQKLREWNPLTKQEEGIVPHGSNAGDKITYTEYYCTVTHTWTDRNTAFKNYLFNILKDDFQEVLLEKEQLYDR